MHNFRIFTYIGIMKHYLLHQYQVPLVRKTGGLADTVFDMADQSQPEKANGYCFVHCRFDHCHSFR